MTSSRRASLRLGPWLAAAIALAAGGAFARSLVPELPQGEFRVSRGIPAPWLDVGAASADSHAWLGDTVSLTTRHFTAPDIEGCLQPRLGTRSLPPEGLFQGNLPAPAKDAAARLALTANPTASVSITCDAGVFDLHWVTTDALMIAVDNVIWVLDRSPGARAATDTPEHAVQVLLETHFAGDMGFTVTSVDAKRVHLAATLQRAIDAYFAHPHPQDEPPPINGDPFTDSQEYPVVFSVREATYEEAVARVPVRFDDGHRARQVEFELRQDAGAWRVFELRYEDGSRLTEALVPR
jgi:hypothetical protein